MIVGRIVTTGFIQLWFPLSSHGRRLQAFPSVFAYSGIAYDGVTLTNSRPASRIAPGIAHCKGSALLNSSSVIQVQLPAIADLRSNGVDHL
jgi:hypothetical protein